MTLRSCIRAAAVCASVPLVLLTASPAFAYIRDDGDDPGPGLTVLETVAIYVGVPALVFAVLAALVYLPSMVRGPRYRPGVSWGASPAVFGSTPATTTEALTEAPTAVTTPPASSASAASAGEAGAEGGGASARW